MMTALLIFAAAAVVAVLALILFAGWIIAAIAEPDPLDSEREYKRGTPGDREE